MHSVLSLSLVALAGVDLVRAGIKGNPKIPSVHPVISVPWGSSKLDDHVMPELWANKPEVPYTKRDATDKYGNGIPEPCYTHNDSPQNGNSTDRSGIKVWEVTFADSQQPLTVCFDETTKDTLDKQLGYLSRYPNNVRSVWRFFISYRGDDDGCGCWTELYYGRKMGTDTWCYGPCSSVPGVYGHEVCNALNSVGAPGDDYDAWVDSAVFADAYNKDSKQIATDDSFEYWSDLCKAADYDVNVPGGFQNLLQYGFDLASVQNQFTEVERELEAQQRSNQSWFKGYSYAPFAVVDKDTGRTLISSTTLTSYMPTNTAVPSGVGGPRPYTTTGTTLQTSYATSATSAASSTTSTATTSATSSAAPTTTTSALSTTTSTVAPTTTSSAIPTTTSSATPTKASSASLTTTSSSSSAIPTTSSSAMANTTSSAAQCTTRSAIANTTSSVTMTTTSFAFLTTTRPAVTNTTSSVAQYTTSAAANTTSTASTPASVSSRAPTSAYSSPSTPAHASASPTPATAGSPYGGGFGGGSGWAFPSGPWPSGGFGKGGFSAQHWGDRGGWGGYAA